MEAARTIGKLITKKDVLNSIKERIPEMVHKCLSLLDDIGVEKVIYLLDTLIDRMGEEMSPYADIVGKKLIEIFFKWLF